MIQLPVHVWSSWPWFLTFTAWRLTGALHMVHPCLCCCVYSCCIRACRCVGVCRCVLWQNDNLRYHSSDVVHSLPLLFFFSMQSFSLIGLELANSSRLSGLWAPGPAFFFFFFFNVGPRDCLQVKEGYLPFEPSPSQPFFLLDVYFSAQPLFKADISLCYFFLRQRCRVFCLFVCFNIKFFIAFLKVNIDLGRLFVYFDSWRKKSNFISR